MNEIAIQYFKEHPSEALELSIYSSLPHAKCNGGSLGFVAFVEKFRSRIGSDEIAEIIKGEEEKAFALESRGERILSKIPASEITGERLAFLKQTHGLEPEFVCDFYGIRFSVLEGDYHAAQTKHSAIGRASFKPKILSATVLALVAFNLTCSGVDGGTAVIAKVRDEKRLANSQASGSRIVTRQPVQFRPTGQSFGIAAENRSSGYSYSPAPEPRRTGPNFSTANTLTACGVYSTAPLKGLSCGQFLSRLAQVESGNNNQAIGDGGRSLGKWQMSHAAWLDVSSLRKSQGLPIYDWETYAHDEAIAREHVIQYLGILRRQFQSAHQGRNPTERQLIGLFQHGFTGMERRGFISKKTKL